jgi:transposase
MSEGGEPSAPATPGLIPLSYTTPWDAALASELANLREQIGRSSRNSSKPPSSDGPGFKPPERRQGSGRKRGGQPGHPGSGPELLPIERVDEVVEHHPDACRR